MLRVTTTALAAAVLVLSVHPASAQEEAVDFTARGGLKDLIGRVDALEAQPDADTLGGLSCSNGEIAKFNGVAWICDVDQDTDTLAGLNCTTDQIAKYDGAAWVCADPESEARTVFVTSAPYDGSLSPDPAGCGTGIAGADCICQYHADHAVPAPLGGVFRAWISDSTGDPAINFDPSAIPYVRVDGVMVASRWEDLVDGSVLAHIEVDENGDHPFGPANMAEGGVPFAVWTNTDPSGRNVTTVVPTSPTLVTVDPDAFPDGTDIRNSYPGVTLFVVGTDGAITSKPVLARSGSSPSPTTGLNGFGQPIDTSLPLKFGWHWDENTYGMLRADFDRPTDYVQIDLIYGDDTVSVLRAFDADGNQLVEVKEDGDGRTADAFDTAVISRTEADIAYIIAGGWAAEATVLDNLKFNLFPEPTPLNACDDWSDNTSASAARTGTFENTWLSWTSKADASCDNPFHLYCVEQE